MGSFLWKFIRITCYLYFLCTQFLRTKKSAPVICQKTQQMRTVRYIQPKDLFFRCHRRRAAHVKIKIVIKELIVFHSAASFVICYNAFYSFNGIKSTLFLSKNLFDLLFFTDLLGTLDIILLSNMSLILNYTDYYFKLQKCFRQ